MGEKFDPGKAGFSLGDSGSAAVNSIGLADSVSPREAMISIRLCSLSNETAGSSEKDSLVEPQRRHSAVAGWPYWG
ncbi:hypothetical protein [Paenibacillus cremeus]|uniref:Uncharacterized protein n=1 Tax=Paenibacillus cremeus TaxID=2163881 RepID=A0A559KA91_9BACL|nr:hypothetical protein [Paenibacillus cremeus]TVY09013.1 hypothetical protein FPZ49_16155 [Paenibacillus cremeus]